VQSNGPTLPVGEHFAESGPARALILEDLNRSAVSFFDQPELLLGRAREARLIADGLVAREAKRLMERLGRSYERLAKCCEERLVGHPPR
jgi:hypothetical protein